MYRFGISELRITLKTYYVCLEFIENTFTRFKRVPSWEDDVQRWRPLRDHRGRWTHGWYCGKVLIPFYEQ